MIWPPPPVVNPVPLPVTVESPIRITAAPKAKTPTMIMHGQNDQRVPIGQAQELYMGLKKNNVPVSLVFYPREGHGLQEPRHQLDKMNREFAWFAKYVLGELKEKDKVPVASTAK